MRVVGLIIGCVVAQGLLGACESALVRGDPAEAMASPTSLCAREPEPFEFELAPVCGARLPSVVGGATESESRCPTEASLTDAGMLADAGLGPLPGAADAGLSTPPESSADAGWSALEGAVDAGLESPPPTAPRNVIVLMGDGVGTRHWDAARIVAGAPLAVDALRGPVLYRTQPHDPGTTTDSAASASALATGRCVENGALAVSPAGRALPTALELSARAGKRTGLVTNTVVLDASPMAFASHVFDRTCLDGIARDLLRTHPDVVMGGALPGDLFEGGRGLRHRAVDAGYHVVESVAQLNTWVRKPALPLFGAFGLAPSVPDWPDWEWGLTPEVLRDSASDEPSLAEMTEAALAALGEGGSGFFLFVENEHPDTVGHAAIQDQALAASLIGPLVLELDRAVQSALAWIEERSSFEETLLLVCADHENGGFTFEGDTLADVHAGRFLASPFHTPAPVAAFARGPGSEALEHVEHVSDLFHLLVGDAGSLPTAPGCDP